MLFADLRGWTGFSASTEPEEVMGVLGLFHAAMGELILEFEATVGWFAGDGLMVWFNDPIPCPDPAVRAVRLAVAMHDAMAELQEVWHRRGHELDLSVGIALGYKDAEGWTTDNIIEKLIATIPLPQQEAAAKVRRA